MKKPYLICLAIFGIVNVCKAQNTFPGTGNVGIGTTSPSAVLDMIQGLDGGNTVTMQTWNWSDVANWGLRLDMHHSGSSIDYNFVQRVGGNQYNVLSFNRGNVGIGTTSPNSMLSLGSAAINKKLFIYDSGTDASGFGQGNSEFRVFGIASGGNHISFGKYDLPTDAFTEQMRIENNGFVGIGTASPGASLVVTGGSEGTSHSVLGLPAIADFSGSFGRARMGIGNTGGPSSALIFYGKNSSNALENKWEIGSALSGPDNDLYFFNAVTNNAPFYIGAGGNVGINNTSPDEKLVVNGNIKAVLSPYFTTKNVVSITALGMSGPTGANNWAIRGVYQYGNGVGLNADGGDLDIIKSLDGHTILGTRWDGAALGNVGIVILTPTQTLSLQNATQPGIDLYTGIYNRASISATNALLTINSNTANPISFQVDASEKMRVDAAGNVAIGTTDPRGFKLAVNGNAIAESMTVKLHANWPDHVFKKDYDLRPLSEVKAYIDQNQHLPEVPSEKEVVKDGIDLGEMNKILLKKVEELTLYLIEKDKQIKDQAAINKTLDERLKTLEQKLATVK